jgi:hypothetical protein
MEDFCSNRAERLKRNIGNKSWSTPDIPTEPKELKVNKTIFEESIKEVTYEVIELVKAVTSSWPNIAVRLSFSQH